MLSKRWTQSITPSSPANLNKQMNDIEMMKEVRKECLVRRTKYKFKNK